MTQHFSKKPLLTHFSRWTRTSYAVFSSLRKVIKISGLSVVIIVAGFVKNTHAQTDTTQLLFFEEELEETEIVAQRSTNVNGDLAKVVSVIDRQDIESRSVLSIQDVLSLAMNVDVRQRGVNDVQADINIRGGTFDQTLILLNGIPFNDAQTGHHKLNLPLDLGQIQRIEILAGSGSRVNGPNAYSGAINIVTRQATENSLDLSVAGGDFQLYKVGASLSIAGNKSSHLVSLNADGSSGYTYNTDYKRANIFYNGRRNFKRSFLQWQGGFTDKAFGANSFYSAKYPDQFEQVRTLFGSMKYQIALNQFRLKANAYYRGHADRFELFRDGTEAASWYNNHNYHWTNIAGLNTNFSYVFKQGVTTLGIDYRFEGIKSNVLGELTGDTIQAFFDPEGFYTRAAERNNLAVYFEQVYRWRNLQIVAGIMANMNSMYSDKIYWNPGIDISFRVNEFLSLLGGINKAMRIPTYTDLYYQGPTNIGNPDLLPEECVNYEIGLSADLKIASFQSTLFYRQGKNTIDWVRTSDTVKWQPLNYTSVNSKGFEMSLGFKPFLRLRNGQYVIQTLSLGYAFNDVDKNSDTYDSYYVMDYLRHKGTVQLTHLIYKNIFAAWSWTYQDRAGNYMHYNLATGDESLSDYPSFNLIDVRLFWRSRNWYIYANMSNLFNVEYVDYGNINQPGRWFTTGIKYSIKFK